MNESQPNHVARFAELDAKPMVPRIAGYLRFMGPGYLQSAMTLGGGSASDGVAHQLASSQS